MEAVNDDPGIGKHRFNEFHVGCIDIHTYRFDGISGSFCICVEISDQ